MSGAKPRQWLLALFAFLLPKVLDHFGSFPTVSPLFRTPCADQHSVPRGGAGQEVLPGDSCYLPHAGRCFGRGNAQHVSVRGFGRCFVSGFFDWVVSTQIHRALCFWVLGPLKLPNWASISVGKQGVLLFSFFFYTFIICVHMVEYSWYLWNFVFVLALVLAPVLVFALAAAVVVVVAGGLGLGLALTVTVSVTVATVVFMVR